MHHFTVLQCNITAAAIAIHSTWQAPEAGYAQGAAFGL
jgi:hypothetical protein